MAVRIVLADLHNALLKADVPILSVRRLPSGTIELVYGDDVTEAQKADGSAILAAYDQDALDAKKPKRVSVDDINAAKTVADLKALLIQMHDLNG